MVCERCGKEFFEDYRKDKDHKQKFLARFCSRACANSRDRSLESREKTAKSVKRKWAENSYKDVVFHKNKISDGVCVICGKKILAQKGKRIRKTCGPACYHELLSNIHSDFLKNPEKRKNYGRGKKSHMEEYFEGFLNRKNITGWEYDKYFWNPILKKSYFTDFCFEQIKFIVELDGTQHLLTEEADKVRDDYFISIGYTVRRIPWKEFRLGFWEDELEDKLYSAGCISTVS